MATPLETSAGEKTDEALLAEARSGDQQALEALLARHQPCIFNIALRMPPK
jgi:hypothetical protein